jgi:hypothetical protein
MLLVNRTFTMSNRESLISIIHDACLELPMTSSYLTCKPNMHSEDHIYKV